MGNRTRSRVLVDPGWRHASGRRLGSGHHARARPGVHDDHAAQHERTDAQPDPGSRDLLHAERPAAHRQLPAAGGGEHAATAHRADDTGGKRYIVITSHLGIFTIDQTTKPIQDFGRLLLTGIRQ